MNTEAMIAFLALLCIIGTAITASETHKQAILKSLEIIEQETSAQECAIIADSLFANTESALKNYSANCKAEKAFEIKSIEGKKSAFCIAENIKTIAQEGKTILEIETGKHYG